MASFAMYLGSVHTTKRKGRRSDITCAVIGRDIERHGCSWIFLSLPGDAGEAK